MLHHVLPQHANQPWGRVEEMMRNKHQKGEAEKDPNKTPSIVAVPLERRSYMHASNVLVYIFAPIVFKSWPWDLC